MPPDQLRNAYAAARLTIHGSELNGFWKRLISHGSVVVPHNRLTDEASYATGTFIDLAGGR